jgi:hypothetical protein
MVFMKMVTGDGVLPRAGSEGLLPWDIGQDAVSFPQDRVLLGLHAHHPLS